MNIDDIDSIPSDQDGPIFREPWEAQAFAMAVSLRDRGLFTWGEWADALGATIRQAQAAGDPDTGATYYHHWLATLEHLVAAKGATDADTPHGQPIELIAADFAHAGGPKHRH